MHHYVNIGASGQTLILHLAAIKLLQEKSVQQDDVEFQWKEVPFHVCSTS